MQKVLLMLLVGATLAISSCSDDDNFDPEAQLAADIIAIDNYLADNNITAIEDDSGLRYVIHEQGTGRPVFDSVRLLLDYTGSTFDGNTFDRNDSFYFALNQGAPEGWNIGLPKINEGGSITMYIPSGLAFGNIDLEGLPANTNVIYQVSVTDSNIQFQVDVAAIDAYLQDNGLVADLDLSGLRYIIREQGDGLAPNSASTVRVNYEGRLLDDTEFDAANDATFDLRTTIPGWQLGLPLLQEGGSVTLIIPSRLAFGPQDLDVIPPNSVLVFDIDLLAVVR